LVRLENTGNWTVFVRVNTQVPEFRFFKSNTEGESKPELGYNLFTLEDIVKRAGWSFDEVRDKGAVILGKVYYACNLDIHNGRNCRPHIDFFRVDVEQNGLHTFSSGFNFRFIRNQTPSSRTLVKVYGIRLLFERSLTASKFDLTATSTTIGAGLALLSVATVVTDFLLQYCIPRSPAYRKNKFEVLSHPSDARDMLPYFSIHPESKEPLLTQDKEEKKVH